MRGITGTGYAPRAPLLNRLNRYAREWGVLVENTLETATSLVAFGQHNDQLVVLKVVKHSGDEWHSGEILEALRGNGVVQVHQHVPGVVLMERVVPGNPLVATSVRGRDEEATEIIATVVRRMSAAQLPHSLLEQRSTWPTLHDWARGFDRYIASGDDQISANLVQTARQVFAQLCASQGATRLLHGDLQHYNVLFDAKRGWLAIDPKGVVGEVEYEIGAALRNPVEHSDLFLSPAVVKRRLKQFAGSLNLNYERVLRWSFAQAVLSAIWDIEDGMEVDENNSALRLAGVLQQID